jgi:type I restriction enzyme S subunit
MSTVLPRYKRTEVGVIPEQWETVPLGSLIGPLDAGVSVRSVPGDGSDVGHDDYVLKTSCIAGGAFFPNEAKSILPADRARARTPVRAGSIIISRMNTPDLVGEVGHVSAGFDNLFLPDRLWMAQRAPGRDVNMKWLATLLAHSAAAQALKDTATGTSGSMKNISKPALRRLLVPLPRPEEQKAIASALGDADALVAALEALIAKKRDIKQGAMQELLTGQRRCRGFRAICVRRHSESVWSGRHSTASMLRLLPTLKTCPDTCASPISPMTAR